MSKHRITRTRSINIPVSVEYEVEFDTETGCADIISHGRVCSFPETVTRRQLQREHTDPDTEDSMTLSKLIDDGIVPVPDPGNVVMLGEVEHIFQPEEDYLDELDVEPCSYTKGELVLEAMYTREHAARRGRYRKKSSRY